MAIGDFTHASVEQPAIDYKDLMEVHRLLSNANFVCRAVTNANFVFAPFAQTASAMETL
jgi:hypothetical protein